MIQQISYDHQYLNFLLLFFGNINQSSSCLQLVINEAETFYNEEVDVADI